MRVIAIIHARGGSVRIPLKNLADLVGKPLIYYIIKAALGAKTIDRIIVSTDHNEIAKISKELGVEVPFKRPADLAEDVPSELVTQHAVKYLEEKENYHPDIIVTLQPTSPFCKSQDIDNCVNKLIKIKADSVVTTSEVEQHPLWTMKVENERLIPFMNQELDGEIGVSQNLQPAYMPNGAVHATTYDTLMKKKSLYGKDIGHIIMPPERSLDIDTPFSLEIAKIIMGKIKNENNKKT